MGDSINAIETVVGREVFGGISGERVFLSLPAGYTLRVRGIWDEKAGESIGISMKRIDVAIGVVIRDRRILICQRKKGDSFGGCWEFPGGKREGDETLEGCLARELKEELRIEARVIGTLTPIRHDYPQVQLTLHPFWCLWQEGSSEPERIECQNLQWVEAGRLMEFKFPPANESLLREINAELETVLAKDQ